MKRSSADSADILPFMLQYEASSAERSPFTLRFEGDSAARLPFFCYMKHSLLPGAASCDAKPILLLFCSSFCYM